ncbi:hypothetical protein [Fodinicola feengrottensis]|uniref:hypothetical protein n=1 Tax=Fodinicola feengrottensis TaxID=435914 RepID=UPI0013D0FF7D|nr:hypothetical protein [Fodinicola feengrottensis]
MTRSAPVGVGLTALAMAQERRIESRRADRLFEDPLAEAFVLAAAGTGDDSGVPGLGGDLGGGGRPGAGDVRIRAAENQVFR